MLAVFTYTDELVFELGLNSPECPQISRALAKTHVLTCVPSEYGTLFINEEHKTK